MRRPSRTTALACLAGLLALAVGLISCRTAVTTGPRDDAKWSSTTTETPQPEEWPPAEYVEQLTPMRELVRSYLRAAKSGDRDAMSVAYLSETRRSAETVIARDLELAAGDGEYAKGPTNTTSVFLFRDELFPSGMDFTVKTEDEARLRELKSLHDDAAIVMARFADGSWRAFFVVRDGQDLRLVP
jgi:hypothetical protein